MATKEWTTISIVLISSFNKIIKNILSFTIQRLTDIESCLIENEDKTKQKQWEKIIYKDEQLHKNWIQRIKDNYVYRMIDRKKKNEGQRKTNRQKENKNQKTIRKRENRQIDE